MTTGTFALIPAADPRQVFLVTPSCTALSFSTFLCETLDDGQRVLIADYSVNCDSPQHAASGFHLSFGSSVNIAGRCLEIGRLVGRGPADDAIERQPHPLFTRAGVQLKQLKADRYLRR